MHDVQAWIRLTDLITDDPSVRQLVRSAVDDPAAYLAAHADTLGARGIDEADEVTPLLALIDALEGVGELAYLDWKAEASEVAAQVARLPHVRAKGVELASIADAELLEDAVRAANALLAPAGLAIVMLDEDSDAYPLVAVSLDRLDALEAASAAVQVELQQF